MGVVGNVAAQLAALEPCTTNNCCDKITALESKIAQIESKLAGVELALAEAREAKAIANNVAIGLVGLTGTVGILQGQLVGFIATLGAVAAGIAAITAQITALAASLAALAATVAPLVIAVAAIAGILIAISQLSGGVEEAKALAAKAISIAQAAANRAEIAINNSARAIASADQAITIASGAVSTANNAIATASAASSKASSAISTAAKAAAKAAAEATRAFKSAAEAIDVAEIADRAAKAATQKAVEAVNLATEALNVARNKALTPGLPGRDGTLGAPGIAGIAGAPGRDGAPGQSIEGARGLPGSIGAQGIPGIAGAPGLPGTPGRDGAPGLPGVAAPTDLSLPGRVTELEKKERDRPKITIPSPTGGAIITSPGGTVVNVPSDEYIDGEFVEIGGQLATINGQIQNNNQNNEENKRAIAVINSTCCNPETKTEPKVELSPVILQKFLRCNPDTKKPEYTTYTATVIKGTEVIAQTQALQLAQIEGQQCNNQECLECVSGTPEWWEVRPGSNRPQLLLLFSPEGSNRANYQITIPHWDGEKPSPKNPPLREYRKGDVMGVLHLADTSKLIVNCQTSKAAKIVIEKLSKDINRTMVDGGRINYTEIGNSNIKVQTMICRYAIYYPQGQKTKTPEWKVKFEV